MEKLAIVAVNELRVDLEYQQEPLHSFVDRLARDWDDEYVGVITVAEEDGHYYIIDGRTRVEAAKKRGVKSLTARVLQGLDLRGRAQEYLKRNQRSSS